ncbi:MAG: hypothetical protein EBR87_11045 [Cytophagia bacterium]|nr:hypothetical protein [Cytophagia bacterium]
MPLKSPVKQVPLKFKFVLPGYNLRPLEIEAAAGLSQLHKFPKFLEMRIQNANYFKSKFANAEDFRIQSEIGNSSWFGFAIVLQGRLVGQRESLLTILSKAGIETRPIVSGNFLENPVMEHLPHVIHGDINVAHEIHVNGFFLGNSHLDLRNEIDLFHEVFRDYISGLVEKI